MFPEFRIGVRVKTLKPLGSVELRPLQPVFFCVLNDPIMEEVPFILSKSSADRCDTLQDIMVVLRNSEDTWPRLRDIPRLNSEREAEMKTGYCNGC